MHGKLTGKSALKQNKKDDIVVQLAGICVMSANRTIQFESFIVMKNHTGPW